MITAPYLNPGKQVCQALILAEVNVLHEHQSSHLFESLVQYKTAAFDPLDGVLRPDPSARSTEVWHGCCETYSEAKTQDEPLFKQPVKDCV